MLISKLETLIKADKSFEEIMKIGNLTKSELLYVLHNYRNNTNDEDFALFAEFMFYQNYLYKKYTSSSKIILWSDYHAGSNYENENNLEIMYAYAKKHKIKDLFFLGDLFDRNYSNNKFESFDKLLNNFISKVPYNGGTTNYFLFGNHDYFHELQGNNLEYLLECSRDDFISMGYRNSFISIFNKIISFRHPVSRYRCCNISEINSNINFSGHSHIYDFSEKDNGNYSIKVPSCANMDSLDKLHSEAGFIVLNIKKQISDVDTNEIILSHLLFKNDSVSLNDRQKIKTSFKY